MWPCSSRDPPPSSDPRMVVIFHRNAVATIPSGRAALVTSDLRYTVFLWQDVFGWSLHRCL